MECLRITGACRGFEPFCVRCAALWGGFFLILGRKYFQKIAIVL